MFIPNYSLISEKKLQHKPHYKQLAYFFRSELHIAICRKGEGERDDDMCITTFILVLDNRIQVCNGYTSMKMLLHTCHNFDIIGASTVKIPLGPQRIPELKF